METVLPTDWFSLVGFIVLALITGGVNAMSVITSRRQAADMRKEITSTSKEVSSVKYELTNSHDTNVRDDISEISEMLVDIKSTVSRIDRRTQRHDKAIAEIRADMRDDREAVSGLEHRIDQCRDRSTRRH